MATGFPVAEARPGAQVPADLVEAVLDLGPHRPVAMTAVAKLVHRGSLGAADAHVEHARSTFDRAPRLRLQLVLALRKKQLGPGRRSLFADVLPKRGLDRGALLLARLRLDLEPHPHTG